MVGAAVLAVLGPPSAAADATTYADAKFVERTVATGLTQPVGMTWAPPSTPISGRLFVVEKHGVVKTFPPNAPEGATPTTVLDLRDQVNSYLDRGLLGVAVDSQFGPANPYLYLAYTAEPYPADEDSSAPAFSRLVKVRLTPDGGGLANPLAPEEVILGSDGALGPCPETPSNDVDCIPSDGASHSIGTVRSAPDGSLYLGSGDAAPFNAENQQALRALDERSPAGKILHIDRKGNGLSGHRFCPAENDLTRVCTKVHAKGLRNPFRYQLRPGGGLSIGDVGWNTSEEINLLDQGGADLGWPCHEAAAQTPGYRAFAACQAEYSKTPQTHRPPDHSYSHQPTGVGGSIIGGPEHPGAPYPEGFRGALFFGDYSQGFIRYLERDGGGALVSRSFATDWSGTDLELTPRGDLAYADVGDFSSGTGSIRRIAYSAPVARISAAPTYGPAPLGVTFDAGGSTAPNGGSLTYRWEFGDGTTSTARRPPPHTYPNGSYTARLTVTTASGATASETVRISAGNTPPRPQIAAPADGSTYRGGQTIPLSGEAPDAEEGELSGPQLQWQVKTIHREHVHVNTRSGKETSFVADTEHDADSHLEMTLTATDSGGLSAAQTVRLDPLTAALRLRSSPSGATVSWAGSDLTTPFEGVTTVGFRSSVSAPASFVSGGRRHDFVSWSDGGARLHPVTVPDAGVSLEARYRVKATPPPPSKPPAAKPPTTDPPDVPSGETPTLTDRRGPRLRFAGFDPTRGTLTGRASDAAGVSRVELALLRRSGRRCRFWSARRRGFGRPRSCRRPQLMRARLKGVRWRLALGRSLPVGIYRLSGRARDRRGNLTRRFSGGQSSLRLRVLRRRLR